MDRAIICTRNGIEKKIKRTTATAPATITKNSQRENKEDDKNEEGSLIVGFSPFLQIFLWVFVPLFFFCWIVCVCAFMFNSEKLQRVLKLINYKMLYLLCFSLCHLCACVCGCGYAYMIFTSHTYCYHMHFDRCKARFSFISNIGKRVSNFPYRFFFCFLSLGFIFFVCRD